MRPSVSPELFSNDGKKCFWEWKVCEFDGGPSLGDLGTWETFCGETLLGETLCTTLSPWLSRVTEKEERGDDGSTTYHYIHLTISFKEEKNDEMSDGLSHLFFCLLLVKTLALVRWFSFLSLFVYTSPKSKTLFTSGFGSKRKSLVWSFLPWLSFWCRSGGYVRVSKWMGGVAGEWAHHKKREGGGGQGLKWLSLEV